MYNCRTTEVRESSVWNRLTQMGLVIQPGASTLIPQPTRSRFGLSVSVSRVRASHRSITPPLAGLEFSCLLSELVSTTPSTAGQLVLAKVDKLATDGGMKRVLAFVVDAALEPCKTRDVADMRHDLIWIIDHDMHDILYSTSVHVHPCKSWSGFRR